MKQVLKNEDFHYNNKVNKHKIDNAALMFDVAFSNEVTFLTEVWWAHFCNFQAQPAANESWISGRIEAHQTRDSIQLLYSFAVLNIILSYLTLFGAYIKVSKNPNVVLF